MSKEFPVQVVTPASKMASVLATEVVLPAYDGQTGVLPEHGDFIGSLGSGALKIVSQGQESWFFIDSGVYRVKSGELSILALIAEASAEIDLEAARGRIKELEEVFSNHEKFSPEEFDGQRAQYEKEQARVVVGQRGQA